MAISPHGSGKKEGKMEEAIQSTKWLLSILMQWVVQPPTDQYHSRAHGTYGSLWLKLYRTEPPEARSPSPYH